MMIQRVSKDFGVYNTCGTAAHSDLEQAHLLTTGTR